MVNMDFKDQIKLLGERVVKSKEQVKTEEATKTAFILSFIQALGYDITDPNEVVPEFTCDIGIKKGEKIDYAILKNNEPIILIECKHWAEDLNLHNEQLYRYFNVSKAKFGILTNGIIYRFYSDLEEKNKMDEKPFLEVDITDLKDNQIEEIKKFHKSYFDIDKILDIASELKYMNELKQLINNEFNNPSPDFVNYFAKQVYGRTRKITTKITEQFTNLLKRSFQQYISDLITEKLKSALNQEDKLSVEQESTTKNIEQNQSEEKENKIDTTLEELEGYSIVKTILRPKISPSRITYKDTITYFAITLDNSVRKTICRIYINKNKKYITFFDENKKEIKKELESIDNIYNYSDLLFQTIDRFADNE